MRTIFTITLILFSINISAQDKSELNTKENFYSFSANVGLALAKDNYGESLNFDITKTFDDKNTTLGLNFTYATIIRKNDEPNYNLLKYSLLAGNEFSKNKSFKFEIKYGLSILDFKDYEIKKAILGVDAGLLMSYNLAGSMYINLGATSNFNKETSIFMQSFLGFKFII
ncbi:hypothetical protein ACFSQ0_07245 [Mesonia sediminis]|uniref:Outer membrane protein beta-barrel domain-containing protein n=1 Tax=Mesonia sediminis TaxID=1703946 RepID=A0ABW5SF71_9FLAO